MLKQKTNPNKKPNGEKPFWAFLLILVLFILLGTVHQCTTASPKPAPVDDNVTIV